MATLIEKDRAFIWHPFTAMQTSCPIPIVKAEGAYIFAEDGKKYLDGISSWWVNLHGHAHPYIAEKIKMQTDLLEHVIFAGFTHAPAVDLASRLMPLLPGNMSKIFYSDNGSTAVETALKMALQFWHNQNISKTKVICFKNSYHGDTFGAMSAAGKNRFNQPFWKYLFNGETIDVPHIGQEEKAIKQLENCMEQAACFIFEPLILGAGGMVMYSKSGLNALLHLCQKAGVLTIADEVMTGFGRTGPLFACEHLNEKPDLICLSKGLTGGFLSLGLTACKEEIFSAFLGQDQTFLHGHSYTANPLACVSALASLDLLLKETCHQQREMIRKNHEAFCIKHQGHLKLKRIETLGTILALEYQETQNEIYSHCISRGILLRPLGNVLYILPPYCISQDELQRIYTCIEETL